jgi:hypothetical protein
MGWWAVRPDWAKFRNSVMKTIAKLFKRTK